MTKPRVKLVPGWGWEEVVSRPGAAVTVTCLHLSKEGRKKLCVDKEIIPTVSKISIWKRLWKYLIF